MHKEHVCIIIVFDKSLTRKGVNYCDIGDFLFQDYSRYGRSLTQEAFGPVISDISEIFKIYAQAKNGEFDKAQEEAIKLAFNNIPGRNLFYVDVVLNHKENML